MQYMCKFLRVCVLSLVSLPVLLIGANAGASPEPWSLQSGWWKGLVDESKESSDERITDFLESLKTLDLQVPQESREVVQSAITRISDNIKQYRRLRLVKGWEIEAAPTALDVYTIEQLLESARQVKADQSDLLVTEDSLERLEAVQHQIRRRIDQLDTEYSATAPKSLQRTLTGLSMMVAITNHAVLKEHIRRIEEKLLGIEQRAVWNAEILKQAKERLDLASIDLTDIDIRISEASAKEREIQKELLQIEVELIPNGSVEGLNSQTLVAINKLIVHAQAQTQRITGLAKKALKELSKVDSNTKQTSALVDTSKAWLKELADLEKQTAEWKDLVRREQDVYEKQRLAAEDATDDRAALEFRQTVRVTLTGLEALNVELYQAVVLAKIVSSQSVEQLHWFTGFLERAYFVLEEAAWDIIDWLSYPLIRLGDKPITAFKILRALSILILAYGVSAILGRAMGELASRKTHISKASLYTFKRVAHYVILLIGLLWALSSLGADFSSLLIIGGALSVGIGFGLQGIVNNFLGGLIVLFDRKLRIGDFIELSGGETGHITEVNVQNTVIRTLDGHDILVPNSDIITRQLTNWTLRDRYARFHLPFGVAYGSDKDKVKEVVEAAALQVPETLIKHKSLPDPTVWLVGFGDSSLDFELVVWVDFRKSKKRQSSLRAAYFWEIETALTQNGLEIPFPQRDVHIKSEKETKGKRDKK